MKSYLLTQSADGAEWTTELELLSGMRRILASHLHSISPVGVADDHANPKAVSRPAPDVSILSRDPYQIRLTWEESK